MTEKFLIDKKNVEDLYALSPLQEGILFHYLQDPENDLYFEQLWLSLDGRVSAESVRSAWNRLAIEHEALRTVFRWEKLGQTVQVVLKRHKPPFHYEDLSAGSEADRQRSLAVLLEADRRTGLDLRTAPFRVTLVKMQDDRFEMILSNHHILWDGWSLGILLAEFLAAYEHPQNLEVPDAEPRLRYGDYVRRLLKEDKEKEKTYWKTYLAGIEEGSRGKGLIAGARKKNRSCYRTSEWGHCLTDAEAQQVAGYCRSRNLTAACFLYAVWGLLLQSYTNSRDTLFGTIVSGRQRALAGIQNSVGLYINTVPLRVTTRPGMFFSELAADLQKTLWERQEFEHSALVDIRSYAGLPATESLFDTLVVIENYPLLSGLEDDGRPFKMRRNPTPERTNYALTLGIELFQGLRIRFIYQEVFFEKCFIQDLAEHYRMLILGLIRAETLAVDQMEIVTAEEKRRMLEWNRTAADYPRTKCIHELFEAQALATPQAIAVMHAEKALSYEELNRRADQLAHDLWKRGVRSGACVAVMLERTIDLVAAELAILKCGAAYVPIDPDFPDERQAFMIRDTKAGIVLTHLAQKPADMPGVIRINLDQALPDEGPTGHPNPALGSEAAAYIMYTSGSTGQPKGVVVPHRAIGRLILNNGYAKFDAGDRVAFTSNPAFDAVTMEVWAPLLHGGCVVVIDQMTFLDPMLLMGALRQQAVTVLFMTTAFFNQNAAVNPKAFAGLRFLLNGGERSDPASFRRVLREGRPQHLIHCYGPTETTTFAITGEIRVIAEDAPSVPLGRPIANTWIYILDIGGRVVPIGATGELYIGGAGLAQGYLNRPEQTAERFVPDPFAGSAGARMYRTGDLGKWRSDGKIEFQGRSDHQVKIRGYRIELDEVENCLLRQQAVREVVVLAADNRDGDKALYAYYVSDGPLSEEDLRAHVGRLLPIYMVPDRFIHLKEMPLNRNGKVNRQALPAPEIRARSDRNRVAPRDVLERQLAALWEDVLKVKPIGVRDHFFELGGQSIKVIKLINTIHKNLDVQLSVHDVFTSPTIEKLKAVIQSKKAGACRRIEPVARKAFYGLSFAQNRIRILTQITRDADAYNVPARFPVPGAVDPETLRDLFRKLTDRHESLRTRFEQTADGPAQIIEPVVPVKIDWADLTGLADGTKKERARELYLQLQKTAFDLRALPLFRLIFVRYEKEKGELFVTMHHIITDAWSMDILRKELLVLLEARWSGGDAGLPALTVTYKDFTAWQQRCFDAEGGMRAARDFWRCSLAESYTPLNLPTLRPDWPKSGPGAAHKVFIPETDTGLLKAVAARKQTTLFIVLLAGLYGYLRSLTNQEDIVVGAVVSGRTHADLQNVVGYFINTIPLRMTVGKKKSFWEILSDTHAFALQALQYQDFPLEKLSEELQAPLPVIQVLLNGVNIAETARERAEDIESFHLDIQNVKFPLQLYLTEYRNGLELIVTYMKDLFEATTIEYMIQEYIRFTVDVMQQIEEKEIIRLCS